MQCVGVKRAAEQNVDAFEQKRARIGAGNTDAKLTEFFTVHRECNRNAREWKVDRAAHAGLAIAGGRRIRRQAHGDKNLVSVECQMGTAVLLIKIRKLDPPALHTSADDLDFRIKNHQSRREISAECGMTPLTLRRNVADSACVFKAVIVGATPPFALVVVDTSCLQAKIAANRRYAPRRRARNGLRSFRKRPVALTDRRHVGELHKARAGTNPNTGGGE